jgi:hypothetical protein
MLRRPGFGLSARGLHVDNDPDFGFVIAHIAKKGADLQGIWDFR